MSANRVWRSLTVAAIAAAALGVTTACSPEYIGETALARDADGNLLALVLACGEKYDRATLYDVTDEDAKDRGRWERRWSFDDAASFSLVDPSGGWSATREWDGTVPTGRIYQLEASGPGIYPARTHSIVFDSSDVEGLEPGGILRAGKDWAATPLRQSMEDYRTSGCR